MKNRIQKDVIMSVEVQQLQNWMSEIVDDQYAVPRYTEDIRQKTFVALDMSTFDRYMATHPDERLQFLRDNGDIKY